MEDSTSLPPDSTDLVGQTLAQFRIQAKLGAGGMGVVYKALDLKLRRVVAVKVLAPSVATDPQGRARFLREARSSAAVTHPNIATVYEVGEIDGRIFLALEHVEGRTLRQRLASGPLSIPEVIHIGREVATGLAKAHGAGIIHRDLTPDNVMVTTDGQVKVLDFGLAKLRAPETAGVPALASTEASAVVSQEGKLIGTPAYMSPEQVTGRPTDPRTDIFSLGAVLYELVTGQRPFRGDTIVDVAIAINRDAPDPPSRLRPAVPPELETVILRCLEKAPASRYATCEDLLDELEVLDTITRTRSVATHDIDGSRDLEPLGASWRAPAVIAAISLLAGVAVIASPFAHSRTPSAQVESAASPPAHVAPRPTAVTDLPIPESPNAEARAAFRAGLQAIRDAAYEVALTRFERAAALDPNLAAAHLRAAMCMSHHGRATEVRESFQRAVSLRSLLSERDQAILDAFEPLLQRQPSDLAEHEARLRAASAKFPYDAELLMHVGMLKTIKPAELLEIAGRVLALDDKYADAWQMKARALNFLGRGDEALKAIERCLEVSPGSNDCLMERTQIFSSRGECAKMEPDSRRWIAKNPSSSAAYASLALVLAVLGRSREAVEEVLEQKWARLPPSAREHERHLDRGVLAFYSGDFAQAETDLQEALRLAATDPNDAIHAHPTSLLFDLYTETRRPAQAAKAAEAYLRRRDAWIEGPMPYPAKDVSPRLIAGQVRAGALSKAEGAALLERWVENWRTRTSEIDVGWIWAGAYASTAETPEEARAALAALDGFPPITPHMRSPIFSVKLGQLYALDGRVAEALPLLKRVKDDCHALEHPFSYTRAQAALGKALESTREPGDRESACATYKSILDRWGSATPRSVTADTVRVRFRALGCK